VVYRVSVVFKGRVQGVYFREYARRWAEALSINGHVKNMIDGTVHAVLEGEPDAVHELIRRLKDEHPQAKVTQTEIKVEEAEGLESFEVLH